MLRGVVPATICLNTPGPPGVLRQVVASTTSLNTTVTMRQRVTCVSHTCAVIVKGICNSLSTRPHFTVTIFTLRKGFSSTPLYTFIVGCIVAHAADPATTTFHTVVATTFDDGGSMDMLIMMVPTPGNPLATALPMHDL